MPEHHGMVYAARLVCRWEVYLCTTADREYAWEAWRLLDPHGEIFPLEQLSWRMLCVSHPQKKDLLNVLRKKEVDVAVQAGLAPQTASDLQLVTDKGEDLPCAAATTSPLSTCIACPEHSYVQYNCLMWLVHVLKRAAAIRKCVDAVGCLCFTSVAVLCCAQPVRPGRLLALLCLCVWS